MKKQFIFILFFLFSSFFSFSQSFNSVITVNGLTCAMCSFSTQKSLEKLDFIKSITPDLEATSFKVEFKEDKFIDFDLIQEKVEDAGFFIGSIDIIFYDNLIAENDKHTFIDNNLFHIFSEGEIETNVFTLVDKNFIRKNDYEIISKKTNHSCYETGIHTDTCCSKHDNLKSNKVFHIKTTL